MTKNNSPKESSELMLNYHQQKMAFLDQLQPDDLRNGESFNQMEAIIDSINQALQIAVQKQHNPEELLNKSFNNLLRENSAAKSKAIDLARFYLKINAMS